MSDDNGGKRGFLSRIQDNYKLVVFDEEALKEVRSFTISPLGFYTWLLLLTALVAILTVSIVAFTPLRRMVPGYGDITDNRAFLELDNRVNEIEQLINTQEVYIDGIKNMMMGLESDIDNIPTSSEVVSVGSEDIKENAKARELNSLYFTLPVEGPISAGYDASIQHYGVDILAPKGSAIKSIMEGVVVNADWTMEGGNSVTIQHPKNILSVYKHNSAILVKAGQKVRKGQAIAIIGNSGTLTDGPHLHLELWYEETPLNPESYLAF